MSVFGDWQQAGLWKAGDRIDRNNGPGGAVLWLPVPQGSGGANMAR